MTGDVLGLVPSSQLPGSMPDGSDRSQDFFAALDARRDGILDACTKCGACVKVCPMPGPAGLDVSDAEAVAAGVIELIRTGEGPGTARRWAEICTGSGHCIPACEYGVNPRFMLALARIADLRSTRPPGDLRTGGGRQFGAMSKGVQTLTRLQLAPDLLARLGQIDALAPEPENPDTVFYTGCNVLKTPHIALLCLDVMDALGVEYVVRGGPSYCCGVYQFRAGDLEKFADLSGRTIDRFAGPASTRCCPGARAARSISAKPRLRPMRRPGIRPSISPPSCSGSNPGSTICAR